MQCFTGHVGGLGRSLGRRQRARDPCCCLGKGSFMTSLCIVSAESWLLLSQGAGSEKQFRSFAFVRQARDGMRILCQPWQHLQENPPPHIYIYLQIASDVEIRVLPEELHLQHNATYFGREQPSRSVAARAPGWHAE